MIKRSILLLGLMVKGTVGFDWFPGALDRHRNGKRVPPLAIPPYLPS
jgi:hypothetical protein